MPEMNMLLTNHWVLMAAIYTAFAVIGLVTAEAKWQTGDSRQSVWWTKPFASLGFLVTAMLVGALESSLGLIIFAGLFLGALGDVLLIPEGKKACFKLGMASFLGGHVAYVCAFFIYGRYTGWSQLAILVTAFLGWGCLRVFWPHVQGVLRPLLVAYIIVIFLMVVSATGMTVARGSAVYLTAAGLFVVSDILIARNRFIRHQSINRVVSLPMYYTSQLMFALAAGAAASY